MKPLTPKALLCVLVLCALACGLSDKLSGGGSMKAAPELWSDVPRMEGATKSEGEMPAWLRLLVRPVLNTMMKGVNDGKDAGNWDFVFFTAPGKAPKDVKAFYTPERMTAQGWERKGDSACTNMGGDGVLLCAFSKRADGKEVGLVVIAAADEQGKETSLFFLRNEATPTPAANK